MDDSEGLLLVTSCLRRLRNEYPADIGLRLPAWKECVFSQFDSGHFPDERDYFLGQLELSAATCARWIGDREASLGFLNRAELHFGHTADAGIGLTDVELSRLVVRYDMGYYDEVLAALPAAQARADSLGMTLSLAKSRMLEGVVLKGLGRVEESLRPLILACESEAISRSPSLSAFAHEFLADSCVLGGFREEANRLLKSASETLGQEDAPTARAFLKLLVGQSLRLEGDLERALLAYLEAREDWGLSVPIDGTPTQRS